MKEKLIDFYWHLLDMKNQIVKDFWEDPKYHVEKVQLEDVVIHMDLAKDKISELVHIPRGYVPAPSIHFTPGVPTEDGWYVVKVTDPRGEYYAIAKTLHGMLMSIAPDINGEHTILSHAKLPEL